MDWKPGTTRLLRQLLFVTLEARSVRDAIRLRRHFLRDLREGRK